MNFGTLEFSNCCQNMVSKIGFSGSIDSGQSSSCCDDDINKDSHEKNGESIIKIFPYENQIGFSASTVPLQYDSSKNRNDSSMNQL